MKAIIFGTGQTYRKHKSLFLDVKVLCFLDNDEAKWGALLDGKTITAPAEAGRYDYDYIFLMSIHFREMREQLKSLGVPEGKIIDREHLGPFEPFRDMNVIRRYEIKRDGDGMPKKGRILLVSHSFGLSGAPVVLVRLAGVLREAGYHVEIYAQDWWEGETLLGQTAKEGLSVSLYARLELLDTDMVCRNYDLVIVNTVTLYTVVQKLSGRLIPVIWWLHEEEDIYRNISPELRNITVEDNTHVYAVGERARAAYMKYGGGLSAEILPYGVEETRDCGPRGEPHEKTVFALIGYGGDGRKGQDIAYEAARRRFGRWGGRVEIWFIGEIPEAKRKIYETIPCLKCMGVLEPEALREVYGQIDVLLCPSLHDPMPVVVTEAMMHKKPCIVSDMTGQQEYIVPYVNGLTCTAGSEESLGEAMQWAIDNREKLQSIGEAGYRIYREHFSMDAFRNHALEIVAKYLPGRVGR